MIRATARPGGGAPRCEAASVRPAAGRTEAFVVAKALGPAPTPAGGPALGGAGPAVWRAVDSLERRRARIDQAIDRAASGAEFSPAELLALQARVYAYNQEVEVLSRALDKAVGAAKTALNTQV